MRGAEEYRLRLLPDMNQDLVIDYKEKIRQLRAEALKGRRDYCKVSRVSRSRNGMSYKISNTHLLVFSARQPWQSPKVSWPRSSIRVYGMAFRAGRQGRHFGMPRHE